LLTNNFVFLSKQDGHVSSSETCSPNVKESPVTKIFFLFLKIIE